MRYRSSLIIVSCALAAACANPAASNTADSSSPTPTPTASGQQPSTTIIVQPGQQAPQAPPKVIVTAPGSNTTIHNDIRQDQGQGQGQVQGQGGGQPLSSQYPANQSPASQSPVSQSPASQPPSGKTTKYLADMDPVENYASRGMAVINGTSYIHSIALDNNSATRDSSVQYDLGRKWQQFDATVGLTDDSPAGQQIQFQIFADGTKVFDRLIDFGSSVSVRLSVSGVLRLKLETLYSGQANIVHAGFGDAMLTGDAATVGATVK